MRAQPVTEITPPRGLELGLREAWSYRELLRFFVWRDVKIRYRQTVVGAGWAILQPFLLMLVFSFFLGRRGVDISSEGLPRTVFYFSALVLWFYFSRATENAASSMLTHQQIIKKIYFPRLLLPTYAVLPPVVDFLMAFVVLVGLVAYEGLAFSSRLWTLPLIFGLALLTALGGGLWLSAINGLYRDVREAIPVIMRFMLFASPIIYPASIVPSEWRWLYALNPMAVAINRFRWGVAEPPGAEGPVLLPVWPAVGLVVVLLVGGLVFFRRIEDTIVDVI